MIRSFRHKGLRRFFEGGDASRLSAQAPDRIARILQAMDQAERPSDLDVPGWRLHELSGDRCGVFSLRVSANWRITFRFDGVDIVDVDMEDYH